MIRNEFNTIMDARIERCREICDSKGKKYSGDGDCFANFKTEAEEMSITPLQVLHTFLGKHLRAVTRYCRTGEDCGEERIEVHITDAINFLLLLEGLVVEAERVDGTEAFKRGPSHSLDSLLQVDADKPPEELPEPSEPRPCSPVFNVFPRPTKGVDLDETEVDADEQFSKDMGWWNPNDPHA